jgi:photosystem II stability/assembly factor-like uncharacterized protein
MNKHWFALASVGLAWMAAAMVLVWSADLTGSNQPKVANLSGLAWAAAPEAEPTIIEIDLSSAPNDLDTPIVITGTDFEDGADVLLDGTPLEDVSRVSDKRLEGTVPWGMDPGIYDLIVVNPGGESDNLPNAFTVTQGIGVWSAGELYGGRVEQLVVNPLTPTTVYAVSKPTGVFRSRDGGGSWSLKIAGPGYISRKLAIDPLSPNRLYIFDTFGFGRSDDEGDTWIPLEMPGPLSALQAYPHHIISGTVFASNHFLDGCGFWKSADAGQTWITITQTTGLTDTCVTAVAFHPTDPQTMVAGSGELFRSTDGGESWSYASWHHPSAMAFNPFGGHELWLSVDETYKSTNAEYSEWAPLGDPVGSKEIRDIQFAPVTWGGMYSGTVFVADSEGNAYKSTDGGDTWEPFGPEALVLDFGLHSTDPDTIYATSSCGGVYKTMDGGATWQQVNQGLTAMAPYELATVPGQPDVVYAVVDGCEGIFEGSFGGDTWQFLPVAGASVEMESSMLVDPHEPTRLYRSGYGTIYRTDDGGQTWPLSGTLPPPAVCSGDVSTLPTVLQADPSQAGTLLAGAEIRCDTPSGWTEIGGIYRSTDSGMTWTTTLTSSQVIRPISDLAHDHLTPTIAYAGTRWSGDLGSGMLRSTDGGQSWQSVARDMPQLQDAIRSIAPEPAPQFRLFVGISSRSADEHCLYLSQDHGETWMKPFFPRSWGVDVLLFAPGDPPVLYAATDRLLRSTDGAQSWTQAAGVLGQVPVYSLAAVEAEGRVVLYAGTTGGHVEGGAAGALSKVNAQGTLVNAGVYRYTTLRRWWVYLPLVLRQSP